MWEEKSRGLRCGKIMVVFIEIGPSPSGKALGFGPSIRRFESCRSSHLDIHASRGGFLVGDSDLRCESCRSSHLDIHASRGGFLVGDSDLRCESCRSSQEIGRRLWPYFCSFAFCLSRRILSANWLKRTCSACISSFVPGSRT